MKEKYTITKTIVSYIRYQLVFCPRYRRKIFAVPGVEDRFRELLESECERTGIDLLEIEFSADYVYLIIKTLPTMSIHDAVRSLKQAAAPIRDEFPELSGMPNLWTRSYFVTTEDRLPKSTIERYVETQKTRD